MIYESQFTNYLLIFNIFTYFKPLENFKKRGEL